MGGELLTKALPALAKRFNFDLDEGGCFGNGSPLQATVNEGRAIFTAETLHDLHQFSDRVALSDLPPDGGGLASQRGWERSCAFLEHRTLDSGATMTLARPLEDNVGRDAEEPRAEVRLLGIEAGEGVHRAPPDFLNDVARFDEVAQGTGHTKMGPGIEARGDAFVEIGKRGRIPRPDPREIRGRAMSVLAFSV